VGNHLCTPPSRIPPTEAMLPQVRGELRIPRPQGCNVVMPTIPIITTLVPENTPAFLTIPTIPVWTATPQLGIGLLPDL
jgi:hypothetical protein